MSGSNNIIHLTDENFQMEVLDSDIPVLVDFWAGWCGPCRMIAPLVEQLAEEYRGKIKVAKLDVDSYGEIAAQFDIMSIPTLILFNQGQLTGQLIGYQPKEALKKFVSQVL
ncbi:MAG: thioredoxin [Bacillota bacterium]